jgi:hypothetical protein
VNREKLNLIPDFETMADVFRGTSTGNANCKRQNISKINKPWVTTHKFRQLKSAQIF